MSQPISFSTYLQNIVADRHLSLVAESIVESISWISQAIKTSTGDLAGTKNMYGEEQLALDVLADRILRENLKKNPLVGLVASEESDGEVKIGDGSFAVVYDPLDGSSLVDVNLSVGTIFGVYKADTLVGVKGEDMLLAGFAVYGPKTTLVLSFGQTVAEFTWLDSEFILTKDHLTVAPLGKMFAPGNLRATLSRPGYFKLMEYWMKEQYTLRYSGGMVPDINQILLKGKGIFTYPGYPEQPEGKLRLLFECAPMAYVMEKAGGRATDGYKRILEKEVLSIDQRTPILIGSSKEVVRAEEMLGEGDQVRSV